MWTQLGMVVWSERKRSRCIWLFVPLAELCYRAVSLCLYEERKDNSFCDSDDFQRIYFEFQGESGQNTYGEITQI